MVIFWLTVMQKNANTAQGQRTLFRQPSSTKQSFENQPTSESLSEGVVFKLKSEVWQGASYANLQEKEHSDLIQRLNFCKTDLRKMSLVQPYLSEYLFTLPYPTTRKLASHSKMGSPLSKEAEGGLWFSPLGILSAGGVWISLSTARLPMRIWKLLDVKQVA